MMDFMLEPDFKFRESRIYVSDDAFGSVNVGAQGLDHQVVLISSAMAIMGGYDRVLDELGVDYRSGRYVAFTPFAEKNDSLEERGKLIYNFLLRDYPNFHELMPKKTAVIASYHAEILEAEKKRTLNPLEAALLDDMMGSVGFTMVKRHDYAPVFQIVPNGGEVTGE